MTKGKMLIAIPSCHSLRHYEQAQRDTWIKDITNGVDYKFFLGKRTGIHDSSLRAFTFDEVSLDVPDTWEGITEKCVEMFRWSLIHGYDFVWKVDLDTLVRPKELLSSGLDQHDWVGGRNSYFASGGAGYGLSRRAMEYVVASPICTTCEEDAHTARALLEHGTELHHDGRFKFIPNDVIKPEDLTAHLSSIRGWAVKYQMSWMYEAYAAHGDYSPLGEPVASKRWLRKK